MDEQRLREVIREELRALLTETRASERLSSVELVATINGVKITAKEYAASTPEAHKLASAVIEAERAKA